jgi:hypothetical protein
MAPLDTSSPVADGPTEDQLYAQLQMYVLALDDWRDAKAAVEALLGIGQGEIRETRMRRVIEAGMGLSYARPFTDNDGVISLTEKRWAPADQALRDQHDAILLLRSKLWAHSSADTGHRMLRHIPADEFGKHPGSDGVARREA